MRETISDGQDVATGSQAIDRVAEATGILPSAVFRTARAMREADPALWPTAAKGGGKGAAHVEPCHLVNLALGLAVAGPIVTVPKAVIGYRSLILHRPSVMQPDQVGQAASMLAAARVFSGTGDYGKNLDRLVEFLADRDDAAAILITSLWTSELVLDPRVPRARVTYYAFDLPDDAALHTEELLFRPRDTPPGISRALDPAWNFLPPATEVSILRTARLPVALFVLLAEMISGARADIPSGKVSKHKSPSQPDAPASASPENENAATPAREAASPNQPSTERERPGPPTPRKVSTRERNLKRSVSAAGHSTSIEERPTNVRTFSAVHAGG